MKNSRLIQILRSCSKKELRELKKWVNSPAHNQREDVILLFNYLIEDGYLNKDEFIAKSQVFKWVYPKTSFDDAKMRQTIFFFMKCLEEFLIFQEFRQDEVKAKIALANVYRKRRLTKPFEKNHRIAHQLLKKHPFRDSQHLQNEYFLEQEQYKHLSTFRRTNLNLQEISDTLDVTFIADKLRQACLMLAHQNVYKTEYDIGLLDQVLTFIEKKGYLDIPAIAMYYYNYKSITKQDNDDYFQNLKKQIVENGHLFPREEIRNIYLLSINYCIARTNAGFEKYLRDAFELLRKGFETKILMVANNTVSRVTFLNAVINGLKLKEFNWVEDFIEKNQKYLEQKYQESFVNFSFALLYFEKKDYDKAMHYLLQYEHDDIIINLRAKNMLLKMYYELGEHDALEYLLESMRNFLVRKKVMGYHKSNFINIIKLTKKLLKVNPYSKHQKAKVKLAIEQANPLTGEERKWFLKQLEEIK